MTLRRLLFLSLAVAIMASFAAPALAFEDEVPPGELQFIPMAREFMADPDDPSTWTIPDPMPCVFCHGTETVNGANIGRGPHGGYLTTTNKCATCHAVHAAPAGSELLLPAATVKATCEVCHDGTGGTGVYGAIFASTGQDPAVTGAVHSIDQTNVIPGGNAADGTDDGTRTFAGESGRLTCTDCHSPHGTDVVNDFIGDRNRYVNLTPATNRLLKRQPTTAAGEVLEYGSDWCGGCHTGRLSGSGPVGNHPVDSAVTQTNPADPAYYYNNVARVAGFTGTPAAGMGPMGRSNLGYVMTDPRAADQVGHYPICQQCHEDARSVGDVTAQQIDFSEDYFPSLDGSGGSPLFANFPHETQNRGFLIEVDPVDGEWNDDLCLNCHNTTMLP